MKRIILFLSIVSLSISCNKSSSDPDNPVQVELEHYPQEWIFTIDESPTRYTFIRTNLNNMFRKQVDKTYSLVELAKEDNCEFFISQSRSSAGKICYTIQLNKEKKRWCFVAPSTNLQEVHMGMSQGGSEITPPGDEDEYKFFIHKMPKVDGVITAAIESVAKPGYYMSASPPGFNYAQNQMVFTKETSPEKATPWQCR